MANILVIDDSMFMRMRLVDMLKSGGHHVAQTGDSRQGLALAARKRPDCVVLDMLMPDLDGLGFLEEVRRQGLTFPVVVHTADIQEVTRRKCLELGAKGFLNKPPNQEELLRTIDEILGKEGVGACPGS